jgi:hypothetical protein
MVRTNRPTRGCSPRERGNSTTDLRSKRGKHFGKGNTFHKILKSGCRAEESKLRTAGRLANLIAMMCILAWRVLWLCMVNRVSPDLPARLVFTDTEIKLLDYLVPIQDSSRKKHIGPCLIRLARLGGYLARTRDAPPGNLVLWRGMARLIDIHLGFSLAKNVGN